MLKLYEKVLRIQWLYVIKVVRRLLHLFKWQYLDIQVRLKFNFKNQTVLHSKYLNHLHPKSNISPFAAVKTDNF